MLIIMLVLFIVLLLFGMPIAIGTGLACMTYVFAEGINVALLAQKMYKACDSFSLLAIPLFMLAGEFMNGGGITKRLVELCRTLLGHITGSLGHVTILASMLFASMSGSSAASCASIGSMLIPAMKERGYDDGYAVGVTSCAAVMGPIIPPSIAFVIYCSLTGDSISQLFIGGIIPGILMGGCLMIIAYIIAKKKHFPVEKKASWKERWSALLHAIPALMMPVIILGGTMTGICTATEAGCIGCVYGIIVGFATKQLKLKNIPGILLSAAKTTAAIVMIIATSSLLAWILTSAQVPQHMTTFFVSVSNNAIVAFLMMMVLILILGCFMVDAAIMPIMSPLLIPIVTAFGINRIQFGVVINMMAVAGGITPPVGNLLYIAAGIGQTPVKNAIKGTIPFLIALFIAMLLCVFIPQIVTFLPGLFT